MCVAYFLLNGNTRFSLYCCGYNIAATFADIVLTVISETIKILLASSMNVG